HISAKDPNHPDTNCARWINSDPDESTYNVKFMQRNRKIYAITIKDIKASIDAPVEILASYGKHTNKFLSTNNNVVEAESSFGTSHMREADKVYDKYTSSTGIIS